MTAESFIHQCLGEGGDGCFIGSVVCPISEGHFGCHGVPDNLTWLGVTYKLELLAKEMNNRRFKLKPEQFSPEVPLLRVFKEIQM